MCSVIGVFSKAGKDVSGEAHELLCALKRRGPEAFGVRGLRSEKRAATPQGLLPLPISPVCLAHCLLSTTGHGVQPFTEGPVSIAHNGQIYNYLEIDSKLAGRKIAAQTPPSSDSEVIARFFATELGGKKKKGFYAAAKKFMGIARGEYAIGALFGGELYALRDFTGQKPLWFGESAELMAFASEPGALRKIGVEFPQPLGPGHLLRVGKKGFSASKIFDFADFRKTISRKHSSASLKPEFDSAIDSQTRGLKKAAVLFSGGVDSSLIAKTVAKRVPQTKLFVAGLEGSHDVLAAQRAATELGLELETVLLREPDVQRLALRAMGIMGFFDEMQVGIAVPELACAEAISKRGFKVVFSGQGSDEIFCGYSSYAAALESGGYKGVEKELWAGLERMWSRNFYRDDIILASESLELRLPFMAQDFLAQAMAIPCREKILSAKDGLRKHPVRELARLCGVPDSICRQPKKAMQYGSGCQKVVSKIMK